MSTNGSCKQRVKITLKLWKNDGVMKTYHSTKTKRIFAKLKAEKFSKVYIKVSYGKGRTNRRTAEEFYNDGEYCNKSDALEALKAFLEE